jgi:PAS domain S-box-containing protein
MRNQSIDRGRLWEVSSDLLGILNAEGYFEVTNPAWEVALGWTSEAILTTSIFDLIHPDDVEKTRISLQEVAGADSVVLHFENRYRRTDGEYRRLS